MNEWPEFHRLAEYELNEAAQYYDLEEPGLGAAFLEEVDRCLQSVQDSQRPERYSVVRFVAGFSDDFRTRSSIRSIRGVSGFSR